MDAQPAVQRGGWGRSHQRPFKASGPDEVIRGVAADLTPCVTRSLSLLGAQLPLQ